MTEPVAGKTAAVKGLKALIRRSAEQMDVAAYIEQMKNESDRGAIILVATLIDDALAVALKRALPSLNSDERARMFDFSGALGTFSARISMAKGLNLLPRNLMQDIEVIKEMRNVAAHAHDPVTFATPAISAAMAAILDDSTTKPRFGQESYRSAFMIIGGWYADTLLEGEKLNDRRMRNFSIMVEASIWAKKDG